MRRFLSRLVVLAAVPVAAPLAGGTAASADFLAQARAAGLISTAARS
ncbi:hypothetical protein [Actinoplanes sp. NBRC 103695]|nr:hypothetical protein [Actinoplanes sp. NBRC 103695]